MRSRDTSGSSRGRLPVGRGPCLGEWSAAVRACGQVKAQTTRHKKKHFKGQSIVSLLYSGQPEMSDETEKVDKIVRGGATMSPKFDGELPANESWWPYVKVRSSAFFIPISW